MAKRKDPPISAVGERAYSLRTEPWLPVVIDGEERRVGLDEAIRSAHRIERLALRNPLQWYAAIMFLAAMCTLVLRELELERDALEEYLSEGFPVEVVEEVLDGVDEHLWLVHPTHPFMQEARYVKSEVNRPASSLDPAAAGPSTKLWFGSNYEVGDLQPVDAPLVLMTYWWFSPNANSRPKIDGDEVRSAGSIIGSSAFNSGIRVVPEGASLLEVILRLLHRDAVESDVLPAFLRDVTSLYLNTTMDRMTASGNAVLLFRDTPDGPFTGAVAGGALREGLPMAAATRERRAQHSRERERRDEEIKAIKRRNATKKKASGKSADLEPVPEPLPPFESPYDVLFQELKDAALADPNLVRVEPAAAMSSGKATGASPASRPLAGFSFGANLFGDLEVMFRDRTVRIPRTEGRLYQRGRTRWEYFEVTYRSATTPLFESADRHTAGTALLDLNDDERRAFLPMAAMLLNQRDKLRACMKSALSQGSRLEPVAEGAIESAEQELSSTLAPVVREAIEEVRAGRPVGDDLYRETLAPLRDAARTALEPYMAVARFPAIARALRAFDGNLALTLPKTISTTSEGPLS